MLAAASVTKLLSARQVVSTPSQTSVPQRPSSVVTQIDINNFTTSLRGIMAGFPTSLTRIMTGFPTSLTPSMTGFPTSLTPTMTGFPTIRPKIPNSNANTTAPASLMKGWGFTGYNFGWGACLSEYDGFLDGSTEIDKWASGVATTLMTMLPSMIAFSPLKTADTQTLYYLDALVALATCGFTLLFRVDTWATLPKDKIWRVMDILDKGDINAIYYRTRQDYTAPDLGDISITQYTSLTPDAIGTGTEVTPDRGGLSSLPAVNIDIPRLKRLYEGGRLKKLQQDALGSSEFPDEIESGSMATTSIQNQHNEGPKQPRPYRITVYMVITIFCLIQYFLFLVISSWVFKTDSTFFIWSCAKAGVMIFCWWVAGSFLLASAVRYASTSMWMRPDEIFHIESIPATPDCCGDNASVLFSNPIKERTAHANWGRIKLAYIWSNLTQSQLPRPQRLPYLFPITFKILSIEWSRLNKPHPMVLVVRPTRDSSRKRTAMQWLSGYLQVMHLGGVSFLFGSIALGSLFRTLGFVATFVSAVAFSRLASIQISAWLEKRLGLTIIEYETEREWVAIWFVLNSMPDCFIESKNSSYRYANGYRPHLCTEARGNPATAAATNPAEQGQGKIPMPDTNMLKTTTTQVADVKTICTFCSVALGLALALSVGAVAGTIWSYSLNSKFTTDLGLFGTIFTALSLFFLVWRLWTEFESAAAYGQALQWVGGSNLAR
ncbi:hypothetical protein HOY80DRAFT_999376 [Tuber brumale]|nr:hypothetical protein HOY80DRAFT_999376 [Tuber brumale]